MINAHHPIRLVDEDDVNREAHEKHVHPHQGEPTALEQHSTTGLEAIASEKPAALLGLARCNLQSLTDDGSPRAIEHPEGLCRLVLSHRNRLRIARIAALF